VSTPYLVASAGVAVYVRASGLCSMKNAPMLDAFLAGARSEGATDAYIDLADVAGMDSTFMGLMVGYATTFAEAGGALIIVRPSEKSMALLTLLGLVEIIRVVPETLCPDVRFVELENDPDLTPSQRTDLVKRAHQSLSGLNEANRAKFAPFLAALEADLAKRAPKPA
jgi:anti-anti-sigma factor